MSYVTIEWSYVPIEPIGASVLFVENPPTTDEAVGRAIQKFRRAVRSCSYLLCSVTDHSHHNYLKML